MKRLIIHIPNKHFRQVRYYGFYANSNKLLTTSNLFTSKQLKAMKINIQWEKGLLNSFGYAPLMCNTCGGHMNFSYENSHFPSDKEVIKVDKFKFEIISKFVSYEKKLKKVEFFSNDAIQFLDSDYLKKDVYNEYIMMKCLDCDYEVKHEYDILTEIMQIYHMDYPEDACYECSDGIMIPKNIHFIKKKRR